MEDWGQYILLAIFVVISIAKSLYKGAAEENDTEEVNEEATANEQQMPPFLPLEEAEEEEEQAARARRAAARRQRIEKLRRRRHEELIEAQSLEQIPTSAYEQPVSLETIVDEETEPVGSTISHASPRATLQQTAQSLTAVKPSHPITAQSVAEQEGSSLAAEFDLERAVIYSEVLKPKYQEYE